MPRSRSRVIATALGLALAACEGPTLPSRAAGYDASQVIDGTRFHWPAERLPVRYWTDRTDSVAPYLDHAFSVWESQFLYGEYRGVRVADSASADVLVLVYGPPVLSGPPATLPLRDDVFPCHAVTSSDSVTPDGSQYVGPFIMQVTWDTTLGYTEGYNCLTRVVTHEVGHSLGILQHSPGTDDIMNAFPRVFVPSLADRSTVQQLYHTPANILAPDRPR